MKDQNFRDKLRLLSQTMTHREITCLFNEAVNWPDYVRQIKVSDIRNWLYRCQPNPKRLPRLVPVLERAFKKQATAIEKQFKRLA